MCTGAQFQTYKNCHLENLIGGILSNIYRYILFTVKPHKQEHTFLKSRLAGFLYSKCGTYDIFRVSFLGLSYCKDTCDYDEYIATVYCIMC